MRNVLLAPILAGGVTALTIQHPTVFASASIKPNTSGTTAPGAIRPQPDGGLSATNVTLRDLIEYAFQRHAFDRREVTGGPPWIYQERFDVSAKGSGELVLDADGALRQTWGMLRALLEDRFRLKVREETRQIPVYALVVGAPAGSPGPRLRKSDIDCGAVMKGMLKGQPPALPPGQGPPCSMKTPPGRLFANTAGMPTIASLLSRHVDRPVIDRTGLTGRFDVELEASEIKAAADYKPGRSDLALPPAAGPSIFVAVREQLGLELQPQTAPVPVLVVSGAERPGPN